MFAMKRMVPSGIFLSAWILSLPWGSGSAAIAEEPQNAKTAEVEVEYLADIEYGTAGEDKLFLDVARPKTKSEPLPAVILIHGGAWAGGKKEDFAGLAKQAVRKGFVAVNVEYRLAPKHRFPAQVEDVKCATRWVRAHAQENQIDPDRIGALGMSAGAHLALMLGVMDDDDGLDDSGGWTDHSSRVHAVVSYAGPTQLVGEFGPVSTAILNSFLGGTNQELPDAYRQASPISYVTPDDAPVLLFQGTKDELVPYNQAIMMMEKLSEQQVPGRIEILIGAGHGWGPKEAQRTIDAGFDFLHEHLPKKEGK